MSQFSINMVEDGLYKVTYEENPVYSFKVYPLDLSRKAPPEKLTKHTANCLMNELDKRSGNPRPRSLLGCCHKNAMNLARYLSKKEYNPELHIGCNTGVGRTSEDIIEVFKQIQNVHQWVSINNYTVEICSEGSNSVGQMYVSRRMPNNYKSIIKLTKEQFQNLNVDYITSNNIEQIVKNI
jgi:hypothetical protein